MCNSIRKLFEQLSKPRVIMESVAILEPHQLAAKAGDYAWSRDRFQMSSREIAEGRPGFSNWISTCIQASDHCTGRCTCYTRNPWLFLILVLRALKLLKSLSCGHEIAKLRSASLKGHLKLNGRRRLPPVYPTWPILTLFSIEGDAILTIATNRSMRLLRFGRPSGSVSFHPICCTLPATKACWEER